jgi:glutathione synthase/RimK-type ligase-like ATP-grasp enzyme
MDFSTVLHLTGHRDYALTVQSLAIQTQPLYFLPAQQEKSGLKLLVLLGPGDLMANTPVEFLVEGSDIDLQLLYLMPDGDWPEVIPDHDVMMVAVGESDENFPLLSRLAAYVSDWPRPILNRPEQIAKLSRDGVSTLLQGLPGIAIPWSVRANREDLEAIARGDRMLTALHPEAVFPLIIRPRGSHAGTDLEKLSAIEEIPDYLSHIEAKNFFVSRYMDYRSRDGLFRKYRIVLIEGKPYICHFAVSEHWIIHYANAGMSVSAAKRAEEAHCMEYFESDFARRHAAALRSIHECMGLPYVGIDCAETRSGELLIFEVDNAMIVHALDPEDLFPYKKPAMQKVFAAFHQMLEHYRHP